MINVILIVYRNFVKQTNCVYILRSSSQSGHKFKLMVDSDSSVVAQEQKNHQVSQLIQ